MAILAIVLVLIVVAVYLFIDSIAKKGIESGASSATGVQTRLRTAHVGVFSGELALNDLEIANPPDFDSQHFLALKEGYMALTLRSLLGDHIVIPRLHLEGLDLMLESKEGRSNYKIIMENLKKLRDPDRRSAKRRTFVIREVIVQDVTVHAQVLGLDRGPVLKFKIPDQRLTDVGSNSDLSHVTSLLMQGILQAVIQEAGALLPAAISSSLEKGLSGIGELGDFGLEMLGHKGFKLLGDFAGEALGEEVGKALEDVGKGAGEAVRDNAKTLEKEAGKALGNLLGANRNKEKKKK